MKILAKSPPWEQRVDCDCGAQLAVEANDLKLHDPSIGYAGIELSKILAVECPECDRVIDMSNMVTDVVRKQVKERLGSVAG